MIHPHPFSPDPVYRSMARLPAGDDVGESLVEVAVWWGASSLLAVAHLRAGERFVLSSRGGADPGAHRFVHPSIERGDRTLVEHLGPDCRVTPPDDAVTTVTHPTTASSATATFVLPGGACARISHADLRYTVRYVPAAPLLPARRGDRLFGAATAFALVCTVTVGGWVRGIEHDGLLDRDDDSARSHVVDYSRLARARVYAPTHAEPGAGVEGGTGLRAAGDEGAAGLRRAPRASRTWSTPPRRGPSRDASARGGAAGARERVAGRGVFAALGAIGAGPWQVVVPGDADRHATGAMYGRETGDARGFEGLGLLGTGWGGGGDGGGLVGLGRVHTRGHGTEVGTRQGLGSGSACGCGEGALRQRNTGMAGYGVRGVSGPIVCGVPWETWQRTHRCLGGDAAPLLDPAAIRRVVLRNLGQVRHCYETSLAVTPGAGGRVTARWVIGGDGAVLGSSVTGNDTGSAALGECVIHAVRRWQFPAPDGGGAVTVNYPFDLSVIDP